MGLRQLAATTVPEPSRWKNTEGIAGATQLRQVDTRDGVEAREGEAGELGESANG